MRWERIYFRQIHSEHPKLDGNQQAKKSKSLKNEIQIINFLIFKDLPERYTDDEYAKEHGYITDENAYLDSITERQDFIINMTDMSDEGIKTEINLGESNLNDELLLGLKNFIKTGVDGNKLAHLITQRAGLQLKLQAKL